MTQITHDFFDPTLLATAKHLAVLDNLKRAQAAATESLRNYAPIETECPGCSDAKCGGTATELRTLRDYVSRYGVTLGTGAIAQMTQAAMKESARQGSAIGQEESGNYTYHPKVLEAVFSDLLKSTQRV